MRRVLTIGLLLALAGCGGAAEVTNNSVAPSPSPTPTPGPMLGGVDLDKPVRATGAGARWAIYLAPGTITYTEVPDAAPIDFHPVSPKLANGRATFETRTPEAEPVTIQLSAGGCGAGDAQLPLIAEVRIGSRMLKGCAGPGAYAWAKPKQGASPTPTGSSTPSK